MLKQSKAYHHKPSLTLTFITGLVFVSLACSLGSLDASKIVRIKRILPTFTPTGPAVSQVVPAEVLGQPGAPPANPQEVITTPTPIQRHLPTLTPTLIPTLAAQVPDQPVAVVAAPTDTPTPNPTLAPIPTASTPNSSSPTPTSPPSQNRPEPPPADAPDAEPTQRPEIPGWSFVGVRVIGGAEDVSVVGELVNNTGAPQMEVEVSGTFYNHQDQVIQNGFDTASYVPVDIVPVGAHFPFELVIESSQPVYRLDLRAMSEPANDPPRQDFQISNVSQWTDEETGLYCLGGQVQNASSPLEDYLVVVATAYNDGGNVVSFGEYSPVSPDIIVGEQTSPFEMCLDPLDQQVAHYEVRALGY